MPLWADIFEGMAIKISPGNPSEHRYDAILRYRECLCYLRPPFALTLYHFHLFPLDSCQSGRGLPRPGCSATFKGRAVFAFVGAGPVLALPEAEMNSATTFEPFFEFPP